MSKEADGSAATSAATSATGQRITEDAEIVNRRGLHARASARFVRLAETFDAEIIVSKDGMDVCGTSIMGLMLLAAAPGDSIRISVTGDQAEAALKALLALVAARFDEDL